MMKRIAAVLLVILATLTAAVSADGATRPRFRPAVVGSAGDGRYVVTLAEDGAMEDPAALRQELALIYGAKLEVNASSDARQFTVTTASARARLLSADPRVVEVVEVPITAPAPSHTPASSARLTPRPAGYGDNGQSGTYSYDGAGNIIAIGADTYVYDGAQRLVRSVTRGVQENYTYDAYGNRTSATGAINCLGQTNCAQAVTVDSNTNHLTSINGAAVTYDAAGNIKTIAATSGSPSAVYSYDALGMMTEATVGSDDRQFIYTADDERIAVRQGASWTWMIRDQSGKVLREFTSLESGSGANLTMTNWQWAKDYVWRDGLLLATVSPSGTLHYHLDHLGTPRLITDANGVKIAEHAYYPFGAEINLTPHETIEEAMKFTGHERDIVAGEGRTLDYMHARYYNSTVGRLLSVDPVLHAERALHSPQMWNRYAYAIDNPMVFTDPTGTTVYLVTYTTGNSEGDDEFRRAAQTRAAEIQHQKGYDAKHDTVIVAGLQTKTDFAAAVKQANGMFKQFGKVGEVDLYSHSGSGAGPVFHNAAGKPTQFSGQELRGIQVNWASGGCAKFFGCNTGMNFSQAFATAQHVNAYGQPGYAYFSGSPAERIPIASSGPVYLISAPGFHNPGPMGLGWLAYAAGDAYTDPMVNSHP
jgi:RHS repeat-associated protein